MRQHVWDRKLIPVQGYPPFEVDVCARCGLMTVEMHGVRMIAIPEADAAAITRPIKRAPEDCDEAIIYQVQSS